jgi:hypothetical protein
MMSGMTEARTNRRGEALVRQLKWVHDALRHDLETVSRIADAITNGMPAADVRDGVTALTGVSPIWAFRLQCLHFCQFVHLHHTVESAHLFPAVRESDPAMVAVADRLDAEHATISDQLHDVEAAVEALLDTDDAATRERATRSLRALAEQLLAHLEYEEQQLAPLLGTWTGWPYR